MLNSSNAYKHTCCVVCMNPLHTQKGSDSPLVSIREAVNEQNKKQEFVDKLKEELVIEKNWYVDIDNLAELARYLIDRDGKIDTVYYIQKPYKWEDEWREFQVQEQLEAAYDLSQKYFAGMTPREVEAQLDAEQDFEHAMESVHKHEFKQREVVEN